MVTLTGNVIYFQLTGSKINRITLTFHPIIESETLDILNLSKYRRDMKVTESSESVLAGTKRPPFRLVCRALSATGARLPIRPVVSEEFVVITLPLFMGYGVPTTFF